MRPLPAFREHQVLLGDGLRLPLVFLSAVTVALGSYAIVELSLADGTRVIVGTRRPEELLQAIRTRLGPGGAS